MSVFRGLTRHAVNSVRLMTTKPFNKQFPRNLNEVKLIGSVSNVHTNKNNDTFLYLSTYENYKSYSIHKVVIPVFTLEKFPGSIEEKQKLFITGQLRAKEFNDENGKRGTSVQIVAHNVFQCENNNDNNKLDDQNHVEIESYIWTDVKHKENLTHFHADLRYLKKNRINNGQFDEVNNFMPVMIYDEILRKSVFDSSLNRLDKVRVEGSLKNSRCTDDTGKTQFKTIIVANRVSKLLTITKVIKEKEQIILN
ncbi:uncharacterized protein LOC116352337 [Contarinia nasturtii]|uniref:uncharacterized protein LOC116352337 n=1 Tax=Contarinia nasturtii TaxID=265458 RepID=UPI0012D39E1D|nr:uncharacterized protein LOC116352337 [Contarinia nasturtii]